MVKTDIDGSDGKNRPTPVGQHEDGQPLRSSGGAAHPALPLAVQEAHGPLFHRLLPLLLWWWGGQIYTILCEKIVHAHIFACLT